MAMFDTTFTKIKSLGGYFRFFRRGWGLIDGRHHEWLSRIRQNTYDPYVPNINWQSFPPSRLSIGTFHSPCADFLPLESRRARFLFVPARDSNTIVLHLPATGDHGFLRRLFLYASWLRGRGISSVILESPFYGSRQPKGQTGALLRYVHELPDLGRATIEESVALLKMFKDRGYERQVACGLSQGGLHASMVASTCKWNVGVVAAFAPHSAAPVFTDGVLADAVDWDALGGDSDECRQRLHRMLGITGINNFPEMDEHGKQILIMARDDRYIRGDCAEKWLEHRPQMEMRHVNGGHVTGAMWYYDVIREAIVDAVGGESSKPASFNSLSSIP